MKKNFYILRIKKVILPIIITLFTICLILFSTENLSATKSGLSLWANSVVPSLFPFFVATELLSYTNFSYFLGKFLKKIMRPIFNVPEEGCFALIMGIISGYPMGAKIIANFRKANTFSREECERLLSFTNNSGPLFIVGTIGISIFGNSTIGILLLITHILGALTVGFIFRFWKSDQNTLSTYTTSSSVSNNDLTFANLGEIIGKSITNSINTILLIGGFVVLFSVIISILNTCHLIDAFSNLIQPIFNLFSIPGKFGNGFVSGIFELTNGLNIIGNIPEKKISINIILTAFLLGFGGLSVFLQVWSIISKTDLSIKPYIYGKLLHACISAFYTFCFLHIFTLFNFNLC